MLTRAGRPALQRRHRHLREGRPRDARRRRRQGQRRDPRRRRRLARRVRSAEGGNLGFTQRGRVEFALAGGLINTDAIDNSAGVDISDHEVNIKILLDRVVAAGRLSVEERNALLRSDDRRGRRARAARQLPPERARSRTRASRRSTWRTCTPGSSARSSSRATSTARSRRCPTTKSSSERRAAGLGLTTPELAVLLAYAKIASRTTCSQTGLPDDPDFTPVLVEYFPDDVRERYAAVIAAAPAAARDRRDRARQRHGQPRRDDVRVPARRGDGRDARRDRPRPRSGAARCSTSPSSGTRSRRSTVRYRSTRRRRCTSSHGS